MKRSAVFLLATLVSEAKSIPSLFSTGVDDFHQPLARGAVDRHYRLTIVSPRFAGQPMQARHRMVYDALGPLMKKEIHALAIKAYAPGEI